MKCRCFLALLPLLFISASDSAGQELHCAKAIKKVDKADKKDCKIRKKMFHDRPYKADRKFVKIDKKECKSEVKEFHHNRYPGHVDYYW